MKKYVIGFATGLLIGTMTVGAFAATGSQNIRATYKDIKVAVNNTVVSLKDAQGRTVEPFVYNGTTYLPVRGVATALGQQVSWDASTNTVYVGEQPTKAPASKSTPAGTVLYNSHGIKVTYLGWERSKGLPGDEFKFKIENSNSEEWMISTDDASIGNTQVSFGLITSVAPGKTAYTDTIMFDSEIHDDYHISSYDSISFKLDMCPTTTYDNIYSGEITLTK